VLEKNGSQITLQAFFNNKDTVYHGIPLLNGDRFVETYFTDRWYNIFEIHARDDDHLRGWYVNIALPAELDGNRLSYIDLALDMLVFPDGRQIVLDEDEFDSLDISLQVRQGARAALQEVQALFRDAKWERRA
jgi:protein associated with RNAse G/E